MVLTRILPSACLRTRLRRMFRHTSIHVSTQPSMHRASSPMHAPPSAPTSRCKKSSVGGKYCWPNPEAEGQTSSRVWRANRPVGVACYQTGTRFGVAGCQTGALRCCKQKERFYLVYRHFGWTCVQTCVRHVPRAAATHIPARVYARAHAQSCIRLHTMRRQQRPVSFKKRSTLGPLGVGLLVLGGLLLAGPLLP